jgi:membrane protein DedA with SNARE-associated domain
VTIQPLPGVLGDIQPYVEDWGYLGVGAALLLEDFGLPLPGETALVVSAVVAAGGGLNVFGVFGIGFLAAVIGDNLSYLLGRYAGRALVVRFGRYVGLTEKRLAATEAFFARRGGWIIVIARFFDGLRQANGIVAGIVGMPWARFLILNAIGAALWVGTWTTIGYAAGDDIGPIYATVQRYFLVLLVLAAAVVAAYVGWRLLRRRRSTVESP